MKSTNRFVHKYLSALCGDWMEEDSIGEHWVPQLMSGDVLCALSLEQRLDTTRLAADVMQDRLEADIHHLEVSHHISD